jgi:hypothetical protein
MFVNYDLEAEARVVTTRVRQTQKAIAGRSAASCRNQPSLEGQSCDNASLPGVVPATNPIPGGAGPPSPAPRPSGLAPGPEAVVRNKANSSIADCGLGRACGRTPPFAPTNCARRTQFGLGSGSRRAKDAKQTQFLPLRRSGDRRSREGEACETNPIGPALGRAGPAE